MTEFKPRISWMAWTDPLCRDNLNDKDEETTPWEQKEKKFDGQPIVFNQLIGMFPVCRESLPIYHFKLWRCDTNFRITNEIHRIFNQTPGVETLDVITPYRLRVGVGKLFDDEIVKNRIFKQLKQLFRSKKQNHQAVTSNTLHEMLKAQYPFWAVAYKSQDGRVYQVVHGNTQAEVEQQLLQLTDGTIVRTIKSWNEKTHK